MENVILYGSLKHKGKNVDTISGYKLYAMEESNLDKTYPTIRKGNKDDKVCVMTTNIRDMAFWDEIEGYFPNCQDHSLYLRKKIKTDKGIEGWIYEANPEIVKSNEVLIPSGDWYDYKKPENL